MPEAPIVTTGTIVDHFRGPAYHVALPNGKVLVGHLPKRISHLADSLAPGARVRLEMTPYDFEKARISDLAPHD